MFDYTNTAAKFSKDRVYRYWLLRQWGFGKGKVAFVLLNPSTATEYKDDPTVRRCADFAKAWGYSELEVFNLFGFRSTDPRRLYEVQDPVGPKNLQYLAQIKADKIIAAWGKHGLLNNQQDVVKKSISGLYCFGTNKDNTPLHPLYLSKNTPLRHLDDDFA